MKEDGHDMPVFAFTEVSKLWNISWTHENEAHFASSRASAPFNLPGSTVSDSFMYPHGIAVVIQLLKPSFHSELWTSSSSSSRRSSSLLQHARLIYNKVCRSAAHGCRWTGLQKLEATLHETPGMHDIHTAKHQCYSQLKASDR